MHTIRRSVTIAANANVADQLTVDAVLDEIRRAQGDQPFRVWATESATGLRLGIRAGLKVVGEDLEPNIRATAPNLQDDEVASGALLSGEQIGLSVRNVTAGALTLNYHIQIG